MAAQQRQAGAPDVAWLAGAVQRRWQHCQGLDCACRARAAVALARGRAQRCEANSIRQTAGRTLMHGSSGCMSGIQSSERVARQQRLSRSAAGEQDACTSRCVAVRGDQLVCMAALRYMAMAMAMAGTQVRAQLAPLLSTQLVCACVSSDAAAPPSAHGLTWAQLRLCRLCTHYRLVV